MKKLVLFCITVWFFVLLFVVVLLTKPKEVIEITEEPNVEIVEEIIEKPLSKEELIAKSVEEASLKHNIPIYVIYAIIATESGEYSIGEVNEFNILNMKETAVSNYGCVGLMQVSKYALQDYNKHNKSSYSRDDLYNIDTNIEIGTWYFKQFRSVSSDWTENYMIYNIGYKEYNGKNSHSFYDYEGKWHSNYDNKFFYANNVYPPTDSKHGLYGKNRLPKYNGKRRFEKCLSICSDIFSVQSLEELNCSVEFSDLSDLYYKLKEMRCNYRFSIDEALAHHSYFSKFFIKAYTKFYYFV